MEYSDDFKLLEEKEMEKMAKEYEVYLKQRKKQKEYNIGEEESLESIQKKENIEQLSYLIKKSTKIFKKIANRSRKTSVRSLMRELIGLNGDNAKEFSVISEYINLEVLSKGNGNKRYYNYLKEAIDIEINILKRLINIIHIEKNEVIKTGLHKLLQDRFYILKKINNI